MLRSFTIAVASLVFVGPIRAEPNPIHVYAGYNRSAIPHANRGIELSGRGELAAARRELDEAIRLDPTMWPAYFERARIAEKLHQPQTALVDANEAVRLKPDFFENYWLRSRVFAHLGQYRASLSDANKAVALISANYYEDLPLVLNDRAWLRATCPDASIRDGKIAVSDATKACKRTGWKKANYLDTLAAAYAEVGDFASAARYQEQALAIGHFSASGDEKSREAGARDRLQLYKKQKAFRSA